MFKRPVVDRSIVVACRVGVGLAIAFSSIFSIPPQFVAIVFRTILVVGFSTVIIGMLYVALFCKSK